MSVYQSHSAGTGTVSCFAIEYLSKPANSLSTIQATTGCVYKEWQPLS